MMLNRCLQVPCLLLVLFLISGSNLVAQENSTGDIEQQLYGTWLADLIVDDDQLSALLGEGREAEERLKQYKSELDGITIRLVLNEDGTSEMTTSGLPGDENEVSNQGTWKYVGTEEREVDGKKSQVIKLAGETSGGEKEELEITILSDDSFRMTSRDIESSFFKAPIFKRQK